MQTERAFRKVHSIISVFALWLLWNIGPQESITLKYILVLSSSLNWSHLLSFGYKIKVLIGPTTKIKEVGKIIMLYSEDTELYVILNFLSEQYHHFLNDTFPLLLEMVAVATCLDGLSRLLKASHMLHLIRGIPRCS